MSSEGPRPGHREPPPLFKMLPPGTKGRMKRTGLEWWHWPVAGLLGAQVACRVIAERRPGVGGVVAWLIGSDFVLWAGIAVFWALLGLVVASYRRPFATRWRFAALGGLVLLALAPMTYRTYPSSHDGRPSRVAFRLPLDGPVSVGWGGGSPAVNYHVVSPSQKWAYDLLVTQEGASHKGDGHDLNDYYIYDLPVLAPADGEVVKAHDGDPDMPPGRLGGGSSPAGNHAIIRVAEGEFLFLCHLRPGTLRVKAGDKVRAGEEIGRAGNSGNTSEPHIHVHLQDTDHLIAGEGIPMPFRGYQVLPKGELVETGIPTGGFGGEGFVGQVVEQRQP